MSLGRALRHVSPPTVTRARPCLQPHRFSRSFSQNGPRPAKSSGRSGSRILLIASGAFLGATVLAANASGVVFADTNELASEQGPDDTRPERQPPLTELFRTYIVYSLCSVPKLVDWSPTILSTLLAVPVVSSITEAVVRRTFFDQFVGADTAEEAIPLLHRLRHEGKGCLFGYSVEVDEDAAAGRADGKQLAHAESNEAPLHKTAVEEMIRAIDVAADFEDRLGAAGSQDRGPAGARKTWVAIKMTALLPSAHALIALSRYLVHTRPALPSRIAFPDAPRPSDLAVLREDAVDLSPASSLTTEDIQSLRELRDDLRSICKHAQERGVQIVVDAEYSWYQPAIDAYTLALMREFNKPSAGSVQPLVYQTYQAYLRRTPAYLAHSLAEARADGFALGVKLVRGAYHPHELAAHRLPGSTSTSLSISPDVEPPVWLTKPETDAAYNACVRVLLTAVQDDIALSSASVSAAPSWPWSSRRPTAPQRTGPHKTPSIGVLFGTHNRASCDLILDELAQRGLAAARPTAVVGGAGAVLDVHEATAERVVIAQLYGMHDELTDYVVGRTRSASPFVLKYVPYGGLKEVMPYLSRRAIENKSVLFEGAAAEERKRAWNLMWKRVWG